MLDSTQPPDPLDYLYPAGSVVAASLAGVTVPHLYALVRRRKVPAPAKNGSGMYQWQEADVAAVRQHVRIVRLRRSVGKAWRRQADADAAQQPAPAAPPQAAPQAADQAGVPVTSAAAPAPTNPTPAETLRAAQELASLTFDAGLELRALSAEVRQEWLQVRKEWLKVRQEWVEVGEAWSRVGEASAQLQQAAALVREAAAA